MVKNTTGGSKHKGQARKLVNAPISNKNCWNCQENCSLMSTTYIKKLLYKDTKNE